MKEFQDFLKCVYDERERDSYEIHCKLSLWSVSGSSDDKGKVIDEAYHYWQQYKADGEYSSIIGGKTVVETLKATLEQKEIKEWVN